MGRKAQKLITEAKELLDWLLSLETTPERYTPNDAYSLFSRIYFLIEMLAADTKTWKKASMATALGNIKSELFRLISSPVTS